MPFTSVATPFLLSLTLHFGSAVLTLPGYSATFGAQPEPVAVADCRNGAGGVYLRPRAARVCAGGRDEVPRQAIHGVDGLATDRMGALRNRVAVSLPPGPIPPPDLSWVLRRGAPTPGSHAISPDRGRTSFAALPRVWLSSRGQ